MVVEASAAASSAAAPLFPLFTLRQRIRARWAVPRSRTARRRASPRVTGRVRPSTLPLLPTAGKGKICTNPNINSCSHATDKFPRNSCSCCKHHLSAKSMCFAVVLPLPLAAAAAAHIRMQLRARPVYALFIIFTNVFLPCLEILWKKRRAQQRQRPNPCKKQRVKAARRLQRPTLDDNINKSRALR